MKLLLGGSPCTHWNIKTTQANFPDTIQLGDAFGAQEDGWWSIFSEGE